MLAPWKKRYHKSRQILKSRDVTLPTKFRLVKTLVFPVVMYGCECWTIKKAECWRIDAFELWCWIRLGCFERTALKHVYYLGWNRSPAQAGCMRQVLGPGALGRPRGIVWRGRWEGGSGRGIHVNPWLIHVNVWQKPLQYCKVISLQLRKKKKSPLDSKEIQPVHPKGNESWLFIGRTDAEAETPILWPPDAKNWLIWKDLDVGNDWR